MPNTDKLGRVWHQGKMQMSKPSGYDTHVIQITLTDDTSHSRVVEISFSADDLARALMGPQEIPVSFSANTRLVGTQREHKQEWVAAAKDTSKEDALAVFEVDGWKARKDDFGNGHRGRTHEGVHGYNVTFLRHVDAISGEPIL